MKYPSPLPNYPHIIYHFLCQPAVLGLALTQASLSAAIPGHGGEGGGLCLVTDIQHRHVAIKQFDRNNAPLSYGGLFCPPRSLKGAVFVTLRASFFSFSFLRHIPPARIGVWTFCCTASPSAAGVLSCAASLTRRHLRVMLVSRPMFNLRIGCWTARAYYARNRA